MKATEYKIVETHLVLTDHEAVWLKHYMQNSKDKNESEEDCDMRTRLHTALVIVEKK